MTLLEKNPILRPNISEMFKLFPFYEQKMQEMKNELGTHLNDTERHKTEVVLHQDSSNNATDY